MRYCINDMIGIHTKIKSKMQRQKITYQDRWDTNLMQIKSFLLTREDSPAMISMLGVSYLN
jgi:hypothetical protein